MGGWIADVLHAMAESDGRDETVERIVCAEVRALCHSFPIYHGLDDITPTGAAVNRATDQ